MTHSLVSPLRIGVDAGGTFTDIVVVDAASTVHAFKSPSVPSNPAQGVMGAVALAAEKLGVDLAALLGQCSQFVHGSTVATNILLEKKGAKVALLTTEGFRDSLEIRRGIRRDVWDSRAPLPDLLVPRYLRFPVAGRLDAQGVELAPVDPDQIRAVARELVAEGVESIAICLLHSYRNADHEHAVAAILAEEIPRAFISCSADVAPTIGEYERSDTVVVNAYVAPRIAPYLRDLERQLAEAGLKQGLLVVQSNGGAAAIAELAANPVQMVLSGPSAGAGSLRFFADDAQSEDLVCIEIGGTSCDIMVASRGEIAMSDKVEIDDHHLTIPAVEIHTVGAGGGTISRLDAAGMMQAGPQGAGARPGPAAYGLGGTMPTVTDAQLVLGRLRPGPYAGGVISLNLARARTAVADHLATGLGLSVEDAAAGILRLVDQNIIHAVERTATERGYNPRGFTLVAAGGAGPLHGVSVARSLGCAAVYIPRLAGVFCAFGMCNSDIRHDQVRSWLASLDGEGEMARIAEEVRRLTAAARPVLEAQGFTDARMEFRVSMDLRYKGQQWTVAVDTPDLDPARIRADFNARYERLYGYHQPAGQIQIANIRLAAFGHIDPIVPPRPAPSDAAPEPLEIRDVWDDQARAPIATPVFDGRRLVPGQTIHGPAVIDEATTTLLIGPGDVLRMTGAGNYLVTLAVESQA